MTDGIPHPFEIFYSAEESGYFIFVPEGCVLVNGIVATNGSVQNGNLALDFGNAPPQKVYCHIFEDGDGWKFTVDGEKSSGGAKYNILVARFGQSENDGNSYDVVCSAIIINDDKLVSFMAYKDNGNWTLFEPLVATPDGIISANLHPPFEAGTYYVHVKTKSDGSYEANVDDNEEDTSVSSKEKAVVTTKVCKLKEVADEETGETEIVLDAQYHVGTVVVDGGEDGEVDDISIEEHNGGTASEPKPEHAIKGWHDADTSDSKLGDLLTGDVEDTSRQVLVRNGKGGTTEYLPIGKVEAAKNGKLTILDSEGNTLGEFTANQDDEEPVEVTIPAQVNADWLAAAGPAQILNKPTIPEIPDITATPSGTGNVVTSVTANGHALTVTKGTVKEPSGSDYVDVSSTGVVSAKVPTDGSKGLVTTDTNQYIGSTKTIFGNNHIFCQDSKDNPTTKARLTYADVRFFYTQETPYDPGIRFLSGLSATSSNAWIVLNRSTNKMSIFCDEGIVLSGGAADKVTLGHTPTIDVSNKTDRNVATCGWVNNKYNVTELVAGSNVTITPDVSNPKKLTIDANIPQPVTGTVNFVGDVQYDVSTHQLQKRVDTLNLATGVIAQGQWVMITGGQAVPHSEE